MTGSADAPRATEHRVVELPNVTAEDLSAEMNRMQADGWNLERVDYIKEPGVRRPQMAFLFFVRPRPDAANDAGDDV